MNTAERTITMRLHVPWEAESSERLYRACRTQDACWNLALDFLIEHPDEPLRKSTRLGVKGLQGRWLEWREEHQWAKKVPQAIWRGGVLRAKEQIECWEQVNEAHGRACLKALEEGKNIPRRVQRRHPEPDGAQPITEIELHTAHHTTREECALAPVSIRRPTHVDSLTWPGSRNRCLERALGRRRRVLGRTWRDAGRRRPIATSAVSCDCPSCTRSNEPQTASHGERGHEPPPHSQRLHRTRRARLRRSNHGTGVGPHVPGRDVSLVVVQEFSSPRRLWVTGSPV